MASQLTKRARYVQRCALLRVAPHQPQVRPTLREVDLVRHAEAEALVIGDVDLLLGLEIRTELVGIAPREHRSDERASDAGPLAGRVGCETHEVPVRLDRKSTRLNSSHI